ncbi:Rqc2 family fibronectin-binding protein [Oribacterium sp. HCP28S3_H8]|uniref:Rqc2 family fibronectin-binding protein n=1 Tax=Oribacterium sp. HCP28S3_H8 TaxID=3438945 RepID=UPI003F8C1CC1
MAYDGLVVSATVKEFNDHLIGGKIAKISQPERDEIQLLIRNQKDNYRLQISVNPSLPLCCFTMDNKPSPITAPSFCMALRKHIGNGTIISIRQPDQDLKKDGLERVILFEIEHLDEMGDLGRRILSVELMGKYSNIILIREDFTIIDSIKRISASQSSVREVLPNRPYFIPDSNGKKNPLELTSDSFIHLMNTKPEPTFKALFHSITGLSPLTASEMCIRAGIDPDLSSNCQTSEALSRLYQSFISIIGHAVLEKAPQPNILYKEDIPQEFSAIHLVAYEGNPAFTEKKFTSMSEVIRTFYAEKDQTSRIRQKSTDLRKVVNTLMERTAKKLAIQEAQLKNTEDMDKYRVYGELLHTYGYSLKGGERSLTCENFYTGKEITIPLKADSTASENAARFLEKYDKLKRTKENVTVQLTDTRRELQHLASIQTSLDIADGEEDLREIRREMADFGFLHKVSGKDKVKSQRKSHPYHYISSDGYDIFVGKNNYQNEEVTFKIADGGDLWLHAKNVPGSHVIVKTGGAPMESLPDRMFLEAAALAAYFSSHRADAKVDVDYTIRKNLKKVPNAAPGFVIYHTNYSVTVKPAILVKEAK